MAVQHKECPASDSVCHLTSPAWRVYCFTPAGGSDGHRSHLGHVPRGARAAARVTEHARPLEHGHRPDPRRSDDCRRWLGRIGEHWCVMCRVGVPRILKKYDISIVKLAVKRKWVNTNNTLRN